MATAVYCQVLGSACQLQSAAVGNDRKFHQSVEQQISRGQIGRQQTRLRIWGEAAETSSPSPFHATREETSDSSSSLFDAAVKGKNSSYPGGMGPHTGRDPQIKKPAWLRQRAPQGERYSEMKESLTSLKLNTVCEEAQCPNIGEV
jgi:hypothetical protein